MGKVAYCACFGFLVWAAFFVGFSVNEIPFEADQGWGVFLASFGVAYVGELFFGGDK